MRIIASDPGYGDDAYSAWAIFDDGEFRGGGVLKGQGERNVCAHLKELRTVLQHIVVDLSIVEEMERRGPDSQVPTSTLVNLAMIGGAMLVSPSAAEYWKVKPSRWKGSVPKRIHNQRTWDELSIEEIRRVDGICCNLDGVPHDLIDAIGIGFYAIGRGVKKI